MNNASSAGSLAASGTGRTTRHTRKTQTRRCTQRESAPTSKPLGNRISERIDAYDRDLLTYFLAWFPYGNPPADEILPRFGFRCTELGERIKDILMAQRE
jgi:hypothetical protein